MNKILAVMFGGMLGLLGAMLLGFLPVHGQPFSFPATPSIVNTGMPVAPMQSQLAVTTSTVVGLTIPAGATTATVCIRSGAMGAINFSVDGSTTPTTGATGAGRQLAIGQCVNYQGAAFLRNFKAIGTAATTAIDVEYGN
jgi:hypothetical protein